MRESIAYRATMQVQRGELDAARLDLEKAKNAGLEKHDYLIGRGQLHCARKAFAEALADCDEAIRCSPNNPIGFLTRGYVRYVSNDLDRAIKDFDKAERLAPGSTAVRAFRSQLTGARRRQ